MNLFCFNKILRSTVKKKRNGNVWNAVAVFMRSDFDFNVAVAVGRSLVAVGVFEIKHAFGFVFN